jgi:hypothetical protein
MSVLNDMPARLPPALKREKFNLYLVNGSEHCLSLTDDSLQAIGVVLAEVDEAVGYRNSVLICQKLSDCYLLLITN